MTGNNTPRRLQALKELEILHRKAHRKLSLNVPSHCRPTINFSDNTTGKVICCILGWLELNNCWAIRMNTTGHYLQGDLFTDVLGHRKHLSGKWTPQATRRRTTDIQAVIGLRPVSIEVSVGSEHISDPHHKAREAIERSGKIYWIVQTLNSCATTDHSHQLGKKS